MVRYNILVSSIYDQLKVLEYLNILYVQFNVQKLKLKNKQKLYFIGFFQTLNLNSNVRIILKNLKKYENESSISNVIINKPYLFV